MYQLSGVRLATSNRNDEEPIKEASPEVKSIITIDVKICVESLSSPKKGISSVRRPLDLDGFEDSVVTKHRRLDEKYHACRSISPILPSNDLSYVPLSRFSKSGLQNESMENVGGTITNTITLEDQVPVGTLPNNSFQGTASPASRDCNPFNIYLHSDGTAPTEPSGPEANQPSQVEKPHVNRNGLHFDTYDNSETKLHKEPSGPNEKEPLFHEAEQLDPDSKELEYILGSSQLELPSENSARSLISLPAEVTIKYKYI